MLVEKEKKTQLLSRLLLDIWKNTCLCDPICPSFKHRPHISFNSLWFFIDLTRKVPFLRSRRAITSPQPPPQPVGRFATPLCPLPFCWLVVRLPNSRCPGLVWTLLLLPHVNFVTQKYNIMISVGHFHLANKDVLPALYITLLLFIKRKKQHTSFNLPLIFQTHYL